MKSQRFFMLMTIAMALLACEAFHRIDPREETERGSLRLNVDAGSASRSLLPDGATIVSYRAYGAGPGGVTVPDTASLTGTYDFPSLALGQWTFTVDGLDAGGNLVATGSVELSIVEGATVNEVVRLGIAPGTGTLDLTITWPSDYTVDAVAGTLMTLAGVTVRSFSLDVAANTATFSGSTQAGSFVLSLSFVSGAGGDVVAAPRTESVTIMEGNTTSGTYALTAADFVPVKYSIDYDSNGATAGDIPNSWQGLPGTAAIVADYIAAPNSGRQDLIRDGFLFAGWCESPTGDTPIYAPGDEIAIPEGGMTLYAQWFGVSAGTGEVNLGPYANGVSFEECPTPGAWRAVYNFTNYELYSYVNYELGFYSYNPSTAGYDTLTKNGAGMYSYNGNSYLALNGYPKPDASRKGDIFGEYQQTEFYKQGTSQASTLYTIEIRPSGVTRSYTYNGTLYTTEWSLSEFLSQFRFVLYESNLLCVVDSSPGVSYLLE
jgi:hypothetical protein